MRAALLLLSLLLLGCGVFADTLEYNVGDEVNIMVNKIGPYSNPTETYPYYSLPFCRPPDAELTTKKQDLGEVLSGDSLMSSLYKMRFQVPITDGRICSVKLDGKQIQAFREAILQEYYFEILIDDMPVWGYVGRHVPMSDLFTTHDLSRSFLLPHLDFSIGYNGKRIVEVNVTADMSKQVELMPAKRGPSGAPAEPAPLELDFTYTVQWRSMPETAYDNRMERYMRDSFFGHELEVHWIGIVNSSIFVVSLTTVLAYIMLRILRRDYQRLEDEEEEDAGWKLLHGDVFRFPSHISILSALLGVGTQLVALCVMLLVLAVVGVFYPGNRGAIQVAALICFSLTAGIAGYVSARWYKRMNGQLWARNILLTGGLVLIPVALVFLVLNTIAAFYHSNAAMPAGTVAVITLIAITVTMPLTLFGGLMGKNSQAAFEVPCRTRSVPGMIPQAPWYRRIGAQFIMAGFLPFSSIYIELYYIYSSIWGHHMYTLFGILLLVFVILLVVTACVTIMHVYFQLSAEDYRWWWASFFYGGSTGLFMYGYCFVFYYTRSNMSGFMQTSFFFGWMAVICYGFFVMLGAVGFTAAMRFVKKIYQAVKSD